MNGLPYYKAYPRDFIEGTIGMPFELKGAYRLVLDLIYMQGGRLPDDPRYISGLLGCSVRKWKTFRSELVRLRKLEIIGEFISNKRAENELETSAKLQEKNAENARNVRKTNSLGKANVPLTRVNTDTDKKIEPNGSTKKAAKRRTQLPGDWTPNETGRRLAAEKGLCAASAAEQLQKFRDYHTAKGSLMADWNAAWRTWLGNYQQFNRPRQGAPPASTKQGRLIQAAMAMNEGTYDDAETEIPDQTVRLVSNGSR